MNKINFEERVKNAVIINSKAFKDIFVDYEYLICSNVFENNYNIIKSDEGNYLHLTGVHTYLSPLDFFDRCYNNTLTVNDFDFIKKNKSIKSTKGSVRDKIISLPQMMNMFENILFVENNYKKNKISCAFATSDNSSFTLGFSKNGRPKSLLRGNKLDSTKLQKVDLIFRKEKNSKRKFNDLIYGNKKEILKYYKDISNLIADEYEEYRKKHLKNQEEL